MRRLYVLLPLLALVACGDGTTVTPRSDGTTPPAHQYAADAPVLRVSYSGGLVPAIHRSALPAWVLYGDGRVITQGPVPAIYPGSALPNVRVTRVSRATIDRIAAAAREAGVDGVERDYGTPPIADGATTDFVLSDAGGTVRRSVYALSEGADGAHLTDAQRAARKRLIELYDHLTDLNGWLGAGTAPVDEDYVPAAVAVLARPYSATGEPGITVQELAWRGADPAAGPRTAGEATCTVAAGPTLDTVLPDLRRANTLTRWTFGGRAYAFVLRPLLPDEKTCEDLT